jgi:hypothetical protein
MSLLGVAADEAFRNSVDLLEEAKLLRDHGKWARSYALAVLAAEEFTKSFEFKCREVGFNLSKVPTKGVHQFRLKRFELLLIVPHLMSVGSYNLLAKFAGVPLRNPDRQFIKSVRVTFGPNAQGKKNSAFYVDLTNGQLQVPSKQIRKDDCQQVISLMTEVVSKKPVFLITEGEKLKSALTMNFLPLFNTVQSELSKAIGKQFLKGA